jgi:hypothetical protein
VVAAGCPRAPVAEREGDLKLGPVRPGPAERHCDFRKVEKHRALRPQMRQ